MTGQGIEVQVSDEVARDYVAAMKIADEYVWAVCLEILIRDRAAALAALAVLEAEREVSEGPPDAFTLREVATGPSLTSSSAVSSVANNTGQAEGDDRSAVVVSEGCGCGHKLDFCHKVNAARYCGAVTPTEVYRQALFACAEAAGADTSGGIPTWPALEAWALQAVQQLRRDYDAASHAEASLVAHREALQETRGTIRGLLEWVDLLVRGREINESWAAAMREEAEAHVAALAVDGREEGQETDLGGSEAARSGGGS